jgi:4a-hydroxytetrahydrobiopterin dehydratase
MSLTQESCTACRIGAPTVDDEEMATLKHEIPEWKLVEEDGVQKLQRIFSFDDFAGALAFTNKVGELAESLGHHPALLTEWGKVTVTWWTHKIDGLHRNDFICAARTDQLYRT